MGSTFKPKLSEGTVELMSSRKRHNPSFEELYKEAKTLFKKKEEKIKEKQKEREEKEMEGVTFKPKILDKSNASKSLLQSKALSKKS